MASAQFFNALHNAARQAAENAVERNVVKKVNDGVDKAFDADTYKSDDEESTSEERQNTKSEKAKSGWTCPSCGTSGNNGKFCNECGTKKPEASDGIWTCGSCGAKGNSGKFCAECGAKQGTATSKSSAPKKEMTSEYVKSDFVPGDEVFFDDDLESEQLGEFPSKWDLVQGNAEVATLNGQKVIPIIEGSTSICPLMNNARNFLGDVYTLELDFWGTEFSEDETDVDAKYFLRFRNSNDDVYGVSIHLFDVRNSYNVFWHNGSTGEWSNTGGEISNLKYNDWNHLAVSFNKRALKVYVNGVRIASVPNVKAAAWFAVENDLWQTKGFIKNIRMAKGAVPLYNRLSSTGKIITYAITFEVGKAVLKPEADVELTRIKGLMEQDPSLKFEVQGHCDNTGTAAINGKLSQQRAEAIVTRLVQMGISANRLSAVGKGSSLPIADNSTDEGRAKNRRVEFIKK